jgi:hypothetical protein
MPMPMLSLLYPEDLAPEDFLHLLLLVPAEQLAFMKELDKPRQQQDNCPNF